MGSYGIGIERILSAAIELYHDKDGMIAAAVHRAVPGGGDARQQRRRRACEAAREDLRRAAWPLGLDALLDDRDERPGVKFKDADLIGIPYRITVGKKLPRASSRSRRTASKPTSLSPRPSHLWRTRSGPPRATPRPSLAHSMRASEPRSFPSRDRLGFRTATVLPSRDRKGAEAIHNRAAYVSEPRRVLSRDCKERACCAVPSRDCQGEARLQATGKVLASSDIVAGETDSCVGRGSPCNNSATP